jgi:hypothetical protein
MFIEPNDSMFVGFTESGIFIERRDFKILPSWKNGGRVLQAHPSCRDVRVNDFVIYRKHAPKELNGVEGMFWALMEQQVLGVLRRGNGDVWFTGKP